MSDSRPLTDPDLTEQEASLIQRAVDVQPRAYAPYSHFPVGAALLSQSGTIHTGVNVEVANYTSGVCAERNALQTMVAEGQRHFKILAIYTDADEPTPPCGACRQAAWEFGDSDAVILTATPDERYRRYQLGELLPDAFGPDSLDVEKS